MKRICFSGQLLRGFLYKDDFMYLQEEDCKQEWQDIVTENKKNGAHLNVIDG